MPDLSLIVPTYNEAANVAELLRRVALALDGTDWEMVFVDDDSADGTAELVRALAQADRRVRCLQRIGRRGLASACVEGMLSSSAPIVAVMDADLQHDERLLPAMFDTLRADARLDVVVGSRYVPGGGTGQWNALRVQASRLATRLGRLVLKADLRDPMSGFFMLRRTAFLECVRAGLSAVGFKILLDLFAIAPRPLRFVELPYEFRERTAGESKLGTFVAWEYIILLLNHLLGGLLPPRFIGFVLVGGVGLLVHMAVLGALFAGAGTSFVVAQGAAVAVAMTGNFLLNNMLTYRDLRLRGWKLLTGWLSFCAACGLGVLANIGVARWLFAQRPGAWMLSAAAGVLAGTVWNYAVTSVFTWKRPRRRPTATPT